MQNTFIKPSSLQSKVSYEKLIYEGSASSKPFWNSRKNFHNNLSLHTNSVLFSSGQHLRCG